MQLKPEQKSLRDLAVVKLQGKLDSQSSLPLQLQQVKALLQQSPLLCVIDMTQVDSVDSSGLHFLATLAKVAVEQKCRLVFSNVQPTVRLALEISQLDQVLNVVEEVEEVGSSDQAAATRQYSWLQLLETAAL